ncbi:hypothetical protein ACOMHN_002379 [Nucella lapillus]
MCTRGCWTETNGYGCRGGRDGGVGSSSSSREMVGDGGVGKRGLVREGDSTGRISIGVHIFRQKDTTTQQQDNWN